MAKKRIYDLPDAGADLTGKFIAIDKPGELSAERFELDLLDTLYAFDLTGILSGQYTQVLRFEPYTSGTMWIAIDGNIETTQLIIDFNHAVNQIYTSVRTSSSAFGKIVTNVYVTLDGAGVGAIWLQWGTVTNPDFRIAANITNMNTTGQVPTWTPGLITQSAAPGPLLYNLQVGDDDFSYFHGNLDCQRGFQHVYQTPTQNREFTPKQYVDDVRTPGLAGHLGVHTVNINITNNNYYFVGLCQRPGTYEVSWSAQVANSNIQFWRGVVMGEKAQNGVLHGRFFQDQAVSYGTKLFKTMYYTSSPSYGVKIQANTTISGVVLGVKIRALAGGAVSTNNQGGNYALGSQYGNIAL